MRFSHLLLSLPAALLLCQCTTPSPEAPAKPESPAPASPAAASIDRTMPGIDTRRLNRMPEGGSEGNISMPILRAPDLEKRWGKPKLSLDFDGNYCLRYSNPERRFQSLSIYGSPEKFPAAGPVPPGYMTMDFTPEGPTTVPVTQQWQTITLFGRTVRYCITAPDSGADVAELTTETITLTGPDGRTGSYCLAVSSDLASGPSSVPGLLRSARS